MITGQQVIGRDERTRAIRRHLTILAGARVAGMSGYWAALGASLPIALARPHPAEWLAVLTGCWTAPAISAVAFGRLIDSAGPRVVATVSWSVAALACAFAVIAGPGMPVLAVALAVISLAFGVGMSAGEAAPSWMLSVPNPTELARAGTWLGIALALSVGLGVLGSSALATTGEQAAWLLAFGLCTTGAMLSAIVPTMRPVSATAADNTNSLPANFAPGLQRATISNAIETAVKHSPIIATDKVNLALVHARANIQSVIAVYLGILSLDAAPNTVEPAAQPSSATVTDKAGRTQSGVRGVMAATLGIFIGYGVITLLLALDVTSELRLSYVTYGWLLCIWSLADALTLTVTTRYLRLVTGPSAIMIAAVILAIGEGLALGTSWLSVSIVGVVVYGTGSGLFYMASRAALTRMAPATRHGSVLATWWSVQAVGVALPALFASALVSAASLRTALLVAPILAAVTAVGTGVAGIRHSQSQNAENLL